jgi:8-oxo-dGTP pyrophosphatase MutT (NUDIX family)
MERHLTVSGFVVHEGQTALHWHRKIRAWLPAGGHIELGEDPVEAVLREVREELSVEAEIVPLAPRVTYADGPGQLPPPYTILLENVTGCGRTPDGKAVHIDLIYFCRLLSGFPGTSYDIENPIYWFDANALETGTAVRNGVEVAFPPDVQALGLEALRLAEQAVPAGRPAG